MPQVWKSGADTMPCFPLLQSPQDPCAAGRQDQGDFSLQDGHEAARIGIVSFLIRAEYDLSLSREWKSRAADRQPDQFGPLVIVEDDYQAVLILQDIPAVGDQAFLTGQGIDRSPQG